MPRDIALSRSHRKQAKKGSEGQEEKGMIQRSWWQKWHTLVLISTPAATVVKRSSCQRWLQLRVTPDTHALPPKETEARPCSCSKEPANLQSLGTQTTKSWASWSRACTCETGSWVLSSVPLVCVCECGDDGWKYVLLDTPLSSGMPFRLPGPGWWGTEGGPKEGLSEAGRLWREPKEPLLAVKDNTTWIHGSWVIPGCYCLGDTRSVGNIHPWADMKPSTIPIGNNWAMSCLPWPYFYPATSGFHPATPAQMKTFYYKSWWGESIWRSRHSHTCLVGQLLWRAIWHYLSKI